MPFKTKKQRKACYAKNDPKWDCKKWDSEKKRTTKMRRKRK
jgi:hypothetical protein